MLRTFRYPLRLNRANQAVLTSWLESCRQLYNGALEHRIGAWQKARVSITYAMQTAELTALRAEDDEYAAIPVRVSRSALRRLDRAFQAFFRRVKAGDKPGFPRFRAYGRYDSFSIGRVAPCEDRVRIPKLGPLRFHLYRPLRGTVRDTQLRRSCGRWFVCFSCDLGPAPEKRPPRRIVGIDVGLTHFAVTSDGEVIDNPRWYRQAELLLARRQRALAPKRRGSASREKARLLVGRAHLKIHNQRLDHARKLACSLYARYDAVVFEKLNIAGMIRGRNLGKSIADAGWRMLASALKCKAEDAGAWAIEVDPRGTSSRCSSCGTDVPKTLSDRVHSCHACGLEIDRDLNAARNILAFPPGRGGLGAELFAALAKTDLTDG
jgi:putative transposase